MGHYIAEREHGAIMEPRNQLPGHPKEMTRPAGLWSRLLELLLWLNVVLAVLTFFVAGMTIDRYLKFSGTGTYKQMHVPAQREHLPKSFYDSDELSGYSYDIVPDILHLVRYNATEVDFIDVVAFRSMYLNHRPEKIYVHCSPCGFQGNYTRFPEGINFTFIPAVFPTEVFGIPIKVSHHATDVLRLRALMRYGGYYCDKDVFVIQSLRRFLRYEASLNFEGGVNMGNMVMFFHKNSRFLRLYLDTYRRTGTRSHHGATKSVAWTPERNDPSGRPLESFAGTLIVVKRGPGCPNVLRSWNDNRPLFEVLWNWNLQTDARSGAEGASSKELLRLGRTFWVQL
ncbi:uncharacterized protein [Dermacentor albipictus]|uniref:uncharacterized protein isoform X6 n=1 Tax=Dermacentor albipictus TaxID=60249 RepID=UPI0038FCF5F8